MLVDTEKVVCTEPDKHQMVMVYTKEFYKADDWEE